jgi:uncharacterized SAM-binding protein YcdF (DUF218 family)
MFIFLSKFLPLFVYPLGFASILLLFALICHRNRKTSFVMIVLALAVLWLSSTTGFSNLAASSLEWKYLPPEEVPTAEVMVVLGGGTESAIAPRSTVEINGAGDRVLYAAELYRQGKAAHILLSGGDISWLNGGSATPAQDMAAILSELGVPEDALWLENESQNTYENALYAKEFLGEKKINSILLVTSAMHMPRAVALFEKQGFEVVPLPVDYNVTESNSSDVQNKILDVLPSASNLALTTNAMKEYLGFLIYKLQGWL